MKITLELVRDKWQACYDADRLAELYDRPMTPLEVLTRTDGAWADVPAKDRLWTVCHDGVLPDRMFRLFACDCAERALLAERAAGREPDARSWESVEVARRYAEGKATFDDLSTAQVAARDASQASRGPHEHWAAAKDAERCVRFVGSLAMFDTIWVRVKDTLGKSARDAVISTLMEQLIELARAEGGVA